MPFQLNEAPQLVLNVLKKHYIKRGCCKITAIFCCPPTFGVSVCGCDTKNDGWNGCWPVGLSKEEQVNLCTH